MASSSKPADPVKAQEKVARDAETELLLQPSKRAVLPAPTGWRCRYYETLNNIHEGCYRLGSDFLSKIGLPGHMPPRGERETKNRQKAADCAWWVLHHMEEEARRKRGEGKWTTRYDLAYRLTQLNGMKEKLQPALAKHRAEIAEQNHKETAAKFAAEAKAAEAAVALAKLFTGS